MEDDKLPDPENMEESEANAEGEEAAAEVTVDEEGNDAVENDSDGADMELEAKSMDPRDQKIAIMDGHQPIFFGKK